MLAALPDAEVESIIAANSGLIAANYPGITLEGLRRDVELTKPMAIR